MIKNNRLFYILIFYFAFLIFNFPQSAHTITFESPRYRIKTDILDKELQIYEPTHQNHFSQKGYILSSRVDKNLFTITSSHHLLDLQLPQRVSITINPPDSGLYTIKTFMPNPFANFDGSSSLPDTQCDLKNNPCTPQKALSWNSSSAYGFGYSVKGIYADDDFDHGSRFRPFAKTPLDIAQSDFSSKKNTYQFIMKALPPPNKSSSTYRALIYMIAFPDF